MKANLIGILSETSMHPGAESSTGVVDLPVAREVSTDYPVIVGSSLKGALRESFGEKMDDKTVKETFGEPDKVGALAVTDARLLLLPIRTLIGHYKWVTCPYILERFFRDSKLAGFTMEEVKLPKIKSEQALYHGEEEQIFLEEIIFAQLENDEILEKVCELITPLIYHESLQERLLEQLVIISDEDFAYFAKYGLEIRARNKLESGTKISKNLWYEECLPADTLFYALVICRTGKENLLEQFTDTFIDKPYLQIGGNETIGQGWSVLSFLGGGDK